MLLSTTSGNASMDLIGVNQNSLDFIEIKTKGSPLTKGEKKVRRLIQEKMVNYRIVDADLPIDFKIEERNTQNNQQ
jgi:predicted Holliday junction resolvase-like endonuclease